MLKISKNCHYYLFVLLSILLLSLFNPTLTLALLSISVFFTIINPTSNYKSYLYLLRSTYFLIVLAELYLLTTFYYDAGPYSGLLVNTPLFFNLAGFYVEPFSFFFDKISLIFSVVTLIIGFFALGFTSFYLSGDKNILFFLKFLNLFILSMVFLVKTDSLLVIVLSWEFLGISSFFLIGFYHNKPYVMKSSLKAFFFNRISDLFLFIFFAAFLFEYGTSSLVTVHSTGSSIEFLLLFSLTQLAFIKSAQGVYYFWLPDSMEAPIPASALIHSATLVSAGIYLCLRFRYLLLSNVFLRDFILYHSLISAVIFSFTAFLQYDIKRLLAFSTISNCSFMYFLISLGFLNETLFYFTLHGFLKSLLFLLVGYLIINNFHSQDIRDWKLTKSDSIIVSVLPLFLFSLGGLNLTLSFDIKHSLYNLYCEGMSFYTLLFLFSIYSLNSMLYGLKFAIVKLMDKRVWKKKEHIVVDNKFFIVFSFIIVTLISLFILFIYSNGLVFNYQPLSSSSLLSIGTFILPLLLFFFSYNNNIAFLLLSAFYLFTVFF